ncbi:MAG: GMC family oxidoreductase [Acidimicrobiales bacterium]
MNNGTGLPRNTFDVAIIGSGFGGSVAALRLAEKGWSVVVLEAGKRFEAQDFPKTSWDLRRFLWAPDLGCRGIQRINLLKDVLVLSGAGVGGGSLVYANTLYEPLPQFYDDPQWSHITDWRLELAPHYDTAKRMLGAVENPHDTPADEVMQRVAADMGVADTYHRTPVAVHFGKAPGERSADPFFGGVGPDRTGCLECGACMTGCRHGAKNTLDLNYLHLAELAGAEIRPNSQVVDIVSRHDQWLIDVVEPGPRRVSTPSVTASQVVFAAGALGTQRLLHELAHRGRIEVSPRLGELTRTNSEAIVGATAPADAGHDFTRGVAITSSFHPDPQTHIEPVRYGKGSNSMGLLATLLVDGGGRLPRPLRFGLEVGRHPIRFLRSLSVRRWSERSVIVLVMQSRDNSLRTRLAPSKILRRQRLVTAQGHGEPNPTWIPAANEAARRVAHHIGGQPAGAWNEALLDVPVTAHLIGGCAISDSPETGVIDPYHRVFGSPGLHVVDGAAVSANLGVNPSLTITAQAERAMSFWPNKGQTDPRPAPGARYERVDPVRPLRPVVPVDAPAALRW